MSQKTPDLPPSHPFHVGKRWSIRACLLVFLCLLLLWTDTFAGWTATPAHAATVSNPNPVLKAPSSLTSASGPSTHPDLGHYVQAAQTSSPPSEQHSWAVSMKPSSIALTNAAQHFVSSDGQLLVDIPAGSLTTAQASGVQRAQATGGISLAIRQVKPAAGGLNSEHIFFGTYEFQFFDAQGHPLSGVRLSHPLSIHFHLRNDQQQLLVQGQKVYTFWSQVNGSNTASAFKIGNQVYRLRWNQRSQRRLLPH